MKDADLWAQLQQFAVDDESSSLRFIDRLADENDWAPSYAAEAFQEYLRFVYLAAISERLRTPSDAVDQVWHLHLSFSQSYWVDLCSNILGRRLHHQPTKGGGDELRKYRAAYAETLDSYRREFDEDPPARIWPDPDTRFRALEHFQRIDTAGSVVIGKRLALGFLLLIVALAALIAATGDWSSLRGAVATVALLLGIPLALLGGLWLLEKLGIRGGKSGSGGCAGSCGSGCGGCGGCGS